MSSEVHLHQHRCLNDFGIITNYVMMLIYQCYILVYVTMLHLELDPETCFGYLKMSAAFFQTHVDPGKPPFRLG